MAGGIAARHSRATGRRTGCRSSPGRTSRATRQAKSVSSPPPAAPTGGSEDLHVPPLSGRRRGTPPGALPRSPRAISPIARPQFARLHRPAWRPSSQARVARPGALTNQGGGGDPAFGTASGEKELSLAEYLLPARRPGPARRGGRRLGEQRGTAALPSPTARGTRVGVRTLARLRPGRSSPRNLGLMLQQLL
jgi:hypothetical protein